MCELLKTESLFVIKFLPNEMNVYMKWIRFSNITLIGQFLCGTLAKDIVQGHFLHDPDPFDDY